MGEGLKDWIPLIVAIIAAATALTGYLVNSAVSRQSEKARYYADALSAVEKYYLFRLTRTTTMSRIAETSCDTEVPCGRSPVNRVAWWRLVVSAGTHLVTMKARACGQRLWGG